MKRLRGERGSMGFSESLALKVVSLLLALILWLTILGLKRDELRKNIKFEPLLAPGMMITNKIPSYIHFTFSGPRIMLKEEVEKKLHVIRPDLRRARESVIPIAISADSIGDLPASVRVIDFSPANLQIRLEEVVEAYVPVRPTFKGNPEVGYTLGSHRVTPSKVAVSGPKSMIQTLDVVGTEPFDVEGLKGSKEGVVSVEVDTESGFQLSRDKAVRVIVTTRKSRP